MDSASQLGFIGGETVYRLLDQATCIPLMRRALTALATGQASQMVRPVLPLEEPNVLGMMPAYDRAGGVAGVKVLSVFPDNYRNNIPSHQGAILVFETATGRLKAIVDAESVTAVRTAATSAAATDALARSDASTLAVLGAGLQGRQHVHALRQVRDIEAVTVWDLHAERAEEFASEVAASTGLKVTAMASAADATAKADIVCTVTPSRTPIISLADVRPGTHVNAVGACTADARELEADLVAAARVFVDWQPAALQEAGDLLLAIRDGAITGAHILGEIGSVMQGTLAGRTDDSQITLFEALGQATQDLVAADYVINVLQEGSA